MSLTYADYAALPDDGKRYELLDGELIVTPAPGSPHQLVTLALYRLLWAHVNRHALGEVVAAPLDVIFSDRTVLQPDIVYLQESRQGQLRKKGIVGSPTLVVEVLSPSNERFDREDKFRAYARHGVPHYWIVDVERRTIEANSLGAVGYELDASASGSQSTSFPPFPDLVIDLSTLWPPDLPD